MKRTYPYFNSTSETNPSWLSHSICAETGDIVSVAGYNVCEVADYVASVRTLISSGEKVTINLPKSDVLEFVLDGGNSLIIRPSGTEPKIKIYVSTVGTSADDAKAVSDKIKNSIKNLLGIE